MAYIIGETPPTLGGSIIGKVQDDMKSFRLNGDKMGLSSCSVILGEIQRDPNKDYSDENVKRILASLRKTTLKNPNPDYILLRLVDTYIPPPISDEEILSWVQAKYSNDAILVMGKKALSIIGVAKKEFNGRDFNTDVLKNYIDGVFNG